MLKDTNINPPKAAVLLAQRFKGKGISLYLVGGFVRNALLSLYSSDLDITSCATPEQVITFFKSDTDIKVIPKALNFGTVQINFKLNGKTTVFEHTTFRQDFYHKGGGHRPSSVVFTKDIKKDAQRRDFTINALYYDILTGVVKDPLGGLEDLNKMIIKAANPNAEVTLSNDGLRLMRLARVSAELSFKIDANLFKTAKWFVHYLADITPERKQQELKKIMLADIKYQGFNGAFNAKKHRRGMIILKEMGALKYLFPALLEGDGVTQACVYHAHDVLMHNINTMAQTPPDYVLRLAGLLHDIAKPTQVKKTGKMHYHDAVGAEMAKQMLNDLKTPKTVIRQVATLIKHHMFDLTGDAKPTTIKRKAGVLGFDLFNKLIALRRADFDGSGKVHNDASANKWQNTLHTMQKINTPETISDLAINGKDLMETFELEANETIGWLLKRLHAVALLNPKQNTKTHLLHHAKQLLKERQNNND